MIAQALDAGSLAALITAVGVALGAIGAGYAAVISATRTSQRVQVIDTTVAEINHAVNGKRPGEASMVSQVSDLHADRPSEPPLTVVVADMAAQLSRLQGQLEQLEQLGGGR